MSSAALLGFIVENLGAGEIVVIAFLALVVLGPERIPEMARGAGRMLHNLKKMTGDLTGDMQDVMNDPAMQPIRELGEFATRPRQKLAEYALEAEAEERVRQAEEANPADGPATDGPATDGPATDGPATDGPATDGPATDGPATDSPATDSPDVNPAGTP